MTNEVWDCAIIGDNFMRPEIFAKEITQLCGSAVSLRLKTLPWPDEPMEHGYAQKGLDGLKEYQGDPDDITDFVGNAEILVTQLAPVSAAMLARMPRLRLIAVSRGGPVNIDIKAARLQQIRVVNAPGRNASAVAEFTIGLILAQTRLIGAGHEALRIGEWRGDLYRADCTGRELSEMTVGLIGYGQVGARVVKLLKPFGCRILVHDPYAPLSAQDVKDGIIQVPLARLLAESDIVSLHPRVTPETTGMMNATRLASMKPGSYLINTARGPLLDYQALVELLRQGRLAGAALDTFGIEPVPPDWALLKLPNVTLTPHIAGASVLTVTVAAEMVAEEVRRFLAGEPPFHPC